MSIERNRFFDLGYEFVLELECLVESIINLAARISRMTMSVGIDVRWSRKTQCTQARLVSLGGGLDSLATLSGVLS